ncbi:MAG: WecB/TagA/CpsF family glycosyltransferase [Thermotaleaceae bacterium]
MRDQIKIMDIPIDKVNIEEALDRVKGFLIEDTLHVIYTPNPEIVMAAQGDSVLKEAIEGADLVIPDGIGLIYASKIMKTGLTQRVSGIDLMGEMLNLCNREKKSIYLLGGKPGVAQLACENILKKFPSIQVAGKQDGYFKEGELPRIIQEINDSKADILFVALGAPKQEKWIYSNYDKLKVKIAMGVGGCVDIWAGTAKRAPFIYQKLGMEWFYRLLKEPWRYRRMMVLPKFMLKILLDKSH